MTVFFKCFLGRFLLTDLLMLCIRSRNSSFKESQICKIYILPKVKDNGSTFFKKQRCLGKMGFSRKKSVTPVLRISDIQGGEGGRYKKISADISRVVRKYRRTSRGVGALYKNISGHPGGRV